MSSVENGVGFLGKPAKRSSSSCSDGGFGDGGVRLQSMESFPSKKRKMMMMDQSENHHHHHHHRSFLSSSEIDCGINGDGPTSKTGTGTTTTAAEGTRDIYDVVGYAAATSHASNTGSAAVGRNLQQLQQQPFGFSSINTFKSSGLFF